MTSARGLVLTMAAVGILLCPPDGLAKKRKHPKPIPCPGGRFVVQNDPLIPGLPGSDAVVLAGTMASTTSGCDDVRAKIKATKGATIVTVHWKSCNGLRGGATMKARQKAGHCDALAGVFKARKAHINRHFTAAVQSPPTFQTGPFTDVALTRTSVGSDGGTIAVNDPASPLHGLSIDVPAGATRESIGFTVRYADITATSGLPAETQATSKLIQVETSGSDQWNEFRLFDLPVKVTLPYMPPAEGEESVRFYIIGADGSLEAAGLLGQDTTNKTITFFTRTFADTAPAPRLGGATASAGRGAIRPRVVTRFNGFVGIGLGRLFTAWLNNGTRINSGFLPSLNGWYIPNYGSYYKASRGGSCFGFVGAAKYYFKKRYAPGLYANYHDPNDTRTWVDDAAAIEFTSRVHNALIDIWGRFITGEVNQQAPSSLAVALSIVGALYVTGAPALLYIQQAVAPVGGGPLVFSGAHAISAYRADIGTAGNTITFYLYDPNFPGDNTRRVTYTRTGLAGFSIYPSGTSATSSAFRYNYFHHVGYSVGLTDALLDGIKASADVGFNDASVFPTITINSITGATNGEVVYDRAAGTAMEGQTSQGEHKYITTDNAVTVRGTVLGGLAQSACCVVNNLNIFVSNKSFFTGVNNGPGSGDGTFSFVIPVAQGENDFVLVASNRGGFSNWAGFYRNVIESKYSPAALTVTLDWDQDDSDVDLYVKEPDGIGTTGDTVFYAHRKGAAAHPYLDFDNTVGFGPEHYVATNGTRTLYTDTTEAMNLYGDYTVKVHYYADHDSDPSMDQPISWHVSYRYLAFCPDPCTDPEGTGFWVEGSTDGTLASADSGNCCDITHTGPDWSFAYPFTYPQPDPRDWNIPDPPGVMLP
jgi:hypothetical protein